ncbi:MAG: hypothetical protein OEW77_05490, partial [Gemmatimonadota bacterium]|nr:hypothetical protein [Gemmatimonadota bacterium]
MVTRFPANVTRAVRVSALLCATATLLGAQQPPAPVVARLVAEPANLAIKAGVESPFRVRAYEANGKEIPGAFVRLMAGTRALRFTDTSVVANAAGKYEATAMAQGANGAPVMLTIAVAVTWPALARVEIAAGADALYAGVTEPQRLQGWHADGSERSGLSGAWRSSDPAVATVNRFGELTGVAAGPVTLSVDAEGVKASRTYTVLPNPVTRVEIQTPESQMRTGDVIHLKAVARRANGSEVANYPITWSYTYTPDDSIAPAGIPGGAGIVQYDRFAANYPGRYALIAQAGNATARQAIQVTTRDVRQKIVVSSRGNITDTHTSDLWPWTGKD